MQAFCTTHNDFHMEKAEHPKFIESCCIDNFYYILKLIKRLF